MITTRVNEDDSVYYCEVLEDGEVKFCVEVAKDKYASEHTALKIEAYKALQAYILGSKFKKQAATPTKALTILVNGYKMWWKQ